MGRSPDRLNCIVPAMRGRDEGTGRPRWARRRSRDLRILRRKRTPSPSCGALSKGRGGGTGRSCCFTPSDAGGFTGSPLATKGARHPRGKARADFAQTRADPASRSPGQTDDLAPEGMANKPSTRPSQWRGAPSNSARARTPARARRHRQALQITPGGGAQPGPGTSWCSSV